MSLLASICTSAARTINNPLRFGAVFYLRLATDLGFFYGIAIIQRRIGVGPDYKFQKVALRTGYGAKELTACSVILLWYAVTF